MSYWAGQTKGRNVGFRMFKSDSMPTKRSHPKYKHIFGPFESSKEYKLWRNCRTHKMHLNDSKEMVEWLAKQYSSRFGLVCSDKEKKMYVQLFDVMKSFKESL